MQTFLDILAMMTMGSLVAATVTFMVAVGYALQRHPPVWVSTVFDASTVCIAATFGFAVMLGLASLFA